MSQFYIIPYVFICLYTCTLPLMSLQFVTFLQSLADCHRCGPAEALDIPDTNRQNARRQNVDEAIFWSVVLGSTIPKLRALLKAGQLLRSTALLVFGTLSDDVEHFLDVDQLGLMVSANLTQGSNEKHQNTSPLVFPAPNCWLLLVSKWFFAAERGFEQEASVRWVEHRRSSG